MNEGRRKSRKPEIVTLPFFCHSHPLVTSQLPASPKQTQNKLTRRRSVREERKNWKQIIPAWAQLALMLWMALTSQSYQNSALSPATKVIRTLDGYGAILTEQTYLNGTLKDTWAQNHDAVGHRTFLQEINNPSLPYTFKYQADGNLVEEDFAPGAYYYYGYTTDGRLSARQTPTKYQAVTRDSVGRITASAQTLYGTTVLTESLTWRGDSSQSGDAITRNGSTSPSESRAYGYDSRGHLTGAAFSPSAGLNGSASYAFDGGAAGGLGLRTRVTLGMGLSGLNTTSYGNFARLSSEALSGSLTNSIGTPVTQSYDAAGNVATRTWGSTTDTLTWDAFGQLVGITRTGATAWSAVYDGLGRRLQTTQGSLVIQSSYDPEVEFLDLAETVISGSSTRYWKVVGPDLSGHYGGMQGTGGTEAIYNGATGVTKTVMSDTYGHAEGVLNNSTGIFTWNPSLSDGYGALPGSSSPVVLNGSNDLATALAWRGHFIDAFGYYYLGARYYAPDSASLSPDPLGHAASMDLYSFCNGDPVNNFDPDGRLQTQVNNQDSGIYGISGSAQGGNSSGTFLQLNYDVQTPSSRNGLNYIGATSLSGVADSATSLLEKVNSENFMNPASGGFPNGSFSAKATALTFASLAVTTIVPEEAELGATVEIPTLTISVSKYPDLAENILNAQQAGHPNMLTYGGDAAANRAAALQNVPNISGLSRDEYPFASSMEGGANSWVGHIPPSQQNSQGALMKNFFKANGLKPGDKYNVKIGD
jgi:RHS repeat-associated protein